MSQEGAVAFYIDAISPSGAPLSQIATYGGGYSAGVSRFEPNRLRRLENESGATYRRSNLDSRSSVASLAAKPAMAVIGSAAFAIRRHRHAASSAMGHLESTAGKAFARVIWKQAATLLFLFSALLCQFAGSTALAQQPHGPLLETRIDTFGIDSMPNANMIDYTGPIAFPTGPSGIWHGIHNPTNGGDANTPAAFVSDGFDFLGNSKAGRLFVEDLRLHPNTDGRFGVGWEGDNGGINNAPFLFTRVPAINDFDAYVKIHSQWLGSWSKTALITRVAGTVPSTD
jgi:hypothetical protein